MGDLRTRLAGTLLLLGSVGSTLLHREVWEAARQGPVQPAEFALGLLTFLLASTGLLMLIRGPKPFIRSEAPVRMTGAERTRRNLMVKSLLATGSPEAVLLDTRHGVAMILAYKAISAAAVRHENHDEQGREPSLPQRRAA